MALQPTNPSLTLLASIARVIEEVAGSSDPLAAVQAELPKVLSPRELAIAMPIVAILLAAEPMLKEVVEDVAASGCFGCIGKKKPA